jgi:lipoate-protein ligase A
MPEWSSLADVEQFRQLTQRHAVVRSVDRPTVVLGSTQSEAVLDRAAAEDFGVEVVRRRGGGGAVLLLPGDHLWVDAWIPLDDPLWQADVSRAAQWVGEWWRASLAGIGVDGCEVHQGKALPGPFGALVCFSGRGPGEVFRHGAKVTGVSQWRSREGALFHASAYTHWDPGPLVGLLEFSAEERAVWRDGLAASAVGVADLVPGPGAGEGGSGRDGADRMAALADRLLDSFPGWRSATFATD